MPDAVANFHFIRPWWMLLAPVIVGVWWLCQRQSDPLRGWRVQMDPVLLKTLTVGDKAPRGNLALWWLMGSLLAAVAIAGPTWRLEPSPFAEDASPLMILLKAGDSMDHGDVSTSPMERAKLKIADLADLRKGQPLGLMAYAGSAHLVLPPTRDTEIVAEMAAQIAPEVMPLPGDRLDLALQAAGDLLTENAAGGSLLVIADGIEGDANTIAAATKAAGDYPIQFLALASEDSPATVSLNSVARSLHATVQPLTADETDVTALAHTAARRSLAGVEGMSPRWQEAGYWLVPLIALLVSLSFRRQHTAPVEDIG